MCLLELYGRYRARSGLASGILRRGASFRFAVKDVLFAMGRVNYPGKPFVDEVISVILGAAVRLLC